MNALLSFIDTALPSTKVVKNEDLFDIKDNAINFKDFLSNLLLQTENGKIDDAKLSLKEQIDDKKEPAILKNGLLKNEKIDDKDPTLEDMLNLVLFLKSNSSKGKFPTDSKKLTMALNNEQAIKDFKEIKSFKDLVKVAKKYDIKIVKFDFKKETDKQVETKIDTMLKELTTHKQTLSKGKINLDKTISNSITHKKTSTEKNIQKKESILSSILKKDDKVNLSQTKTIKKISSKPDSKPFEDKIIQDQKHTDAVLTKQDNKLTNDKIIHTAKKEVKNTTDQTKIVKNIPTNQNIKSADDNIIHLTEKGDKKYILNPDNSTNTKDKKDNKPKRTAKTEIKESSLLQKSKKFNKMVDDIKQNNLHKKSSKKVKQNDKPINIDIIKKDAPTKIDSDNIIQSKASSQYAPPQSHISTNVHNIKQSNVTLGLNNFANDLKEQIDNYKPPIMRVKMTLNPKDLGEVNVSIVNRGNNLQVTINSNSNTMALFTQNQAEFKNSLVNMGFTNLNMNFSSNSNSKNRDQNQPKKDSQDSFESFQEQSIEDIDTVNLTIPRYI